MNDLTQTGYFLTGGMVSFVNMTLLQPLFSVKIDKMAPDGIAKSILGNAQSRKSNPIVEHYQALRGRVVQQLQKGMIGRVYNGPLGLLYRGYRANLTCDLANQVVNFYAYAIFKDAVEKRLNRKLGDWENATVGASAGATSAAMLTSLERIMIIQILRAKDPSYLTAGQSSSMVGVAKEIIRAEGVTKALTRGLAPTILREATNSFCFFGLTRIIQPALEERVVMEGSEKSQVQELGIVAASYFTSGVLAGSSTAYFDAVKTRMQKEITPKRVSMTDVSLQLAREIIGSSEGRRGFGKAALARSGISGVSMALMGTLAETIIPGMLPARFHKSATQRLEE